MKSICLILLLAVCYCSANLLDNQWVIFKKTYEKNYTNEKEEMIRLKLLFDLIFGSLNKSNNTVFKTSDLGKEFALH